MGCSYLALSELGFEIGLAAEGEGNDVHDL